MNVTSTVSNVFRFNGSLADLNLGGLLNASLLSGTGGAQSGTFSDNNGQLSQADDGITTFSLNGGTAAQINYIGSGTISTVGVLGINLNPRPLAIFEANGQIFFYAPNGLPPLSGIIFSLDINPNATFNLPAAPDGKVDGLDVGQTMNVGFTDLQGDRITDNSDLIYANGGNDTVRAGGGDDTVFGGLGDDSIFGDAGDDVLQGDEGSDMLLGGAGRDTLFGGVGNDSLEGGDDDDLIDGGIDDDLLSGDEGNDTVLGGQGNDTIEGGLGNDELDGDIGNDSIDGGIGNDTIHGGSGSDVINGGDGNDEIRGGEGADTLSGGDGGDLFIEVTDGDIIDGGSGDPATDFDVLNLTGLLQPGGTYVIENARPDTDPLDGVDDGSPNDGQDGTVVIRDAGGVVTARIDFTNIESIVPCFTQGTLIATAKGQIRVEDLKPGDRVITRDNGLQEIAWVGQKHLTQKDLIAKPELKPVLIKAGSLGENMPERDMMVSPNHRMLIADKGASMYIGEPEVLVAAKHFVGQEGICHVDVSQTSYIHFMFERHEVVLSDGTWTESFYPGDYTIDGLGEEQRAEILSLFPDLESKTGLTGYRTARAILKKYEAKLLLG